MILQGTLDRSLGNFICLRGFAPLGDLYQISDPEPSYQRDLITTHQEDMEKFLDDAEFLFYPEVILGASLDDDTQATDGTKTDAILKLNSDFGSGQSFKEDFAQFKLSYSVTKRKSPQSSRAFIYYHRATLDIKNQLIESNGFNKFHRIDGNHRLSILDKSLNLDEEKIYKYGRLNVPFCLVLFNSNEELESRSSALFHNINYKHIPLTMEQSLKQILDNSELFDDDVLVEKFGDEYSLARKVLKSWDLSMIPNIHQVIKSKSDKKPGTKRTFLLETFKYLTEKKLVSLAASKLEKEANVFKSCLSEINTIYQHPNLGRKRNYGLLSAFIYYFYQSPSKLIIFKNWVLENHIYQTEDTNAKEIIKIFDCVLEAKKRTIFVSMQFSTETKENYEAIKNAVDEINNSYDDYDLELREIRMDQFNKGYSYKIDDEILEQILGCGLMLADVSLGNKNVYHEIGYLMGLNKNSSDSQDNFVLFHNEKIKGASFHDDLGFNLKALKVLTAKNSNDLRQQIQKQVKIYYNL